MPDTFYNSIDKISSQVFNLNSDFALKHVVRVSHKSSDGRKELFHSEYTYVSQSSYVDAKYLKSVKLNFNSYLMIEEVSKDKNWLDKESVFINSLCIYKFRKALKKVKKWFYKYKDLYFYDNKELRLNSEIAKNLTIQINLNGKVIVIQPTIIGKDDTEYEGVVMFINRRDCQCRMTIDRLEALYYIIKKFDLYQAGLSMITYIGRPDSSLFNKDIGIEKKDDVNKFYNDKQYSKGMKALDYSMKHEKEKSSQFANYFSK